MNKYKQKKDYNSFLKIFLLNRDTSKVEDDLLMKSIFKYARNQLSYKENLIDITPWSVIEKKYIPYKTTLLMFDPQNINHLPDHPDISSILYNAISNKINKNQNFFLVSKKERDNMFKKFEIEKKLYTEEYPFKKNMIDLFSNENKDIHFFISSNIIRELPLNLEVTLWNSKKEKIKNFLITRDGKDSIENITLFLNNTLNESLSKITNVIKIKGNSLILNLGKKNKIKEKDIIDIIDTNGTIWKSEVTNLDFYNCEVVPQKWNWRNFIAIGDKAIYTKNK